MIEMTSIANSKDYSLGIWNLFDLLGTLVRQKSITIHKYRRDFNTQNATDCPLTPKVEPHVWNINL